MWCGEWCVVCVERAKGKGEERNVRRGAKLTRRVASRREAYHISEVLEDLEHQFFSDADIRVGGFKLYVDRNNSGGGCGEGGRQAGLTIVAHIGGRGDADGSILVGRTVPFDAQAPATEECSVSGVPGGLGVVAISEVNDAVADDLVGVEGVRGGLLDDEDGFGLGEFAVCGVGERWGGRWEEDGRGWDGEGLGEWLEWFLGNNAWAWDGWDGWDELMANGRWAMHGG